MAQVVIRQRPQLDKCDGVSRLGHQLRVGGGPSRRWRSVLYIRSRARSADLVRPLTGRWPQLAGLVADWGRHVPNRSVGCGEHVWPRRVCHGDRHGRQDVPQPVDRRRRLMGGALGAANWRWCVQFGTRAGRLDRRRNSSCLWPRPRLALLVQPLGERRGILGATLAPHRRRHFHLGTCGGAHRE